MGPHCKFCNQRCFTHNPRRGSSLLATCITGQQHDKRVLGYCYADTLRGLQPDSQPLAHLPNSAGFKFWGMDGNGKLIECEVIRREDGCHDIGGGSTFGNIVGWVAMGAAVSSRAVRRVGRPAPAP